MRSSIEEFVKSEDIDINGDKPISGVSHEVIEQFSAELYKKAYERVVKEIVDKRERIAKHLNDEAKTTEELSKRQLEQLLEQYVSSCVTKIVTTASPVQEEVKAQDVVSALKNVPKGNRKNSQACHSKNVTTLGAAQVKGKGVQQTKKGKGTGKGKPKNKSKGKGQSTAANKRARQRVLAKERRTHPRVKALEKERKETWRQDWRKIERSKKFDDPLIHLFSNLMEGTTMQDWLSLFDFQNTRRHIYRYNRATRCVDQPCQSAAPWPVLWILARFHPRHIWCGKSLPNVDNLKASLNIFANRIRWRWFFVTYRDSSFLCVPSYGKTRVCTHPAAPSLDTWISNLKCASPKFLSIVPVQLPVTDRFSVP